MRTSLRRIGNISSKITGPLLGKQGHVMGAILQDWGKIVGERIVTLALPQKITFRGEKRAGGTLHLLVTSGAGLLIQQISPMIVERVNTYFGYGAVAALKIHQGTLPASVKDDPVRPDLNETEQAWLGQTVGDIENEALRDALENLGKSLIQDQNICKRSERYETRRMM